MWQIAFFRAPNIPEGGMRVLDHWSRVNNVILSNHNE
jgi:hypothetical protein